MAPSIMSIAPNVPNYAHPGRIEGRRWRHALQVYLSVVGEGVPWYLLWLGLTATIVGLVVIYRR
jgi:hypothetical protein